MHLHMSIQMIKNLFQYAIILNSAKAIITTKTPFDPVFEFLVPPWSLRCVASTIPKIQNNKNVFMFTIICGIIVYIFSFLYYKFPLLYTTDCRELGTEVVFLR
jgi:hypothetical protein